MSNDDYDGSGYCPECGYCGPDMTAELIAKQEKRIRTLETCVEVLVERLDGKAEQAET